MTAVAQVLSAVLLLVGLVFVFGGTLGLLRLPDFYARAHAASKCDSVGAGSILLAAALVGGLTYGDLKVLLLLVLILVSGPTTAHALARAAYRTGIPPKVREGGEQS